MLQGITASLCHSANFVRQLKRTSYVILIVLSLCQIVLWSKMTSMVFIYPQHLEFPENFETQSISIFNPHDFTIHFHCKYFWRNNVFLLNHIYFGTIILSFTVECTKPNSFLLSATEGDILAKSALEM